ncbi:MAG: ferritin-like domain-containing protein [Acidobacteriota bacterium]
MMGKELLDKLNEAISSEMQASIQYMWQHVMWAGTKGAAVKDDFKKIAITEMKHAEAIAERLYYLGGTPTTEPAPIKLSKKLEDMVKDNVKAEEEAISMYKEIIRLAEKEGDITTKFLFESILSDEEDHHDYFTTLLEE